MTTQRPRIGRPHEDITQRPGLRLTEEELGRLNQRAQASRRSRNREIATAVDAYLDAHPAGLPRAKPPVGERIQVKLEPAEAQRLAAATVPEERDAHVAAAVRWWLRRSAKRGA